MEKVDDLIGRILEKCKADLPSPCQSACPLHIDARGYVRLISAGKFKEAFHLVRSILPFPDIIGRTCTHPCEQACRRKDVDTPIRICALKRFAATYRDDEEALPVPQEVRQEEIAIVGGGPAGLMAAHDLRLLGYRVTIFEQEEFLGGMLLSSIPEYRLPRDVVTKELALINRLGITVHLKTRIGRDIGFEQLRKDFSAIFFAPGKQGMRELGMPGEELRGVYSGLTFLKKVRQGEKVRLGRRVVVVGGGNVAIDSARTAWRLGAESVTVLYRRSRAEMPAASDEIEEAEEEGIDIRYLALPERIIGEGTRVTGIEYAKAELGEPDASGRRAPVRVPGAPLALEADAIIVATGQSIEPELLSEMSGLFTGLYDHVRVDLVTMATDMQGVFAGGDVTGGEGTVIAALAAGRRAARSIDSYLRGVTVPPPSQDEARYAQPFLKPIEGVEPQERAALPRLAVEERTHSFAEVTRVLSEAEAVSEAGRCLDCRCDSCMTECEFLKKYDLFPKRLAETLRSEGPDAPLMTYSCSVCSLCAAVCPESIDTGRLCLSERERLVDLGRGPLPEHQALDILDQFVHSEAFRFSYADPRTGKCRSLFFPGCGLSGYSARIVLNTYVYLLEKMSDVGILLGCCGAPRHLLGKRQAHAQALEELEKEMRELGAEELIVACPECYKTIGEGRPNVRLASVYEVIARFGVPERASGEKLTFSLHDSCTARQQKNLRESVRALMANMGHEVQESPYSGELARCCGMGGLVPFVDYDLAERVTKRRIEEFQFDIVTYCAACREAFAMEKPSLHVLDLLFNPDWKEAREQPPKTGKKRRQCQVETRVALLEFIQTEQRADIKRGPERENHGDYQERGSDEGT